MDILLFLLLVVALGYIFHEKFIKIKENITYAQLGDVAKSLVDFINQSTVIHEYDGFNHPGAAEFRVYKNEIKISFNTKWFHTGIKNIEYYNQKLKSNTLSKPQQTFILKTLKNKHAILKGIAQTELINTIK